MQREPILRRAAASITAAPYPPQTASVLRADQKSPAPPRPSGRDSGTSPRARGEHCKDRARTVAVRLHAGSTRLGESLCPIPTLGREISRRLHSHRLGPPPLVNPPRQTMPSSMAKSMAARSTPVWPSKTIFWGGDPGTATRPSLSYRQEGFGHKSAGSSS